MTGIQREPDVGRPAGGDAEDEQRVDADHRREVRERDGEVREQAEHAVELRLVAEALEPGVVALDADRCRGRYVVHRALLSRAAGRANLRRGRIAVKERPEGRSPVVRESGPRQRTTESRSRCRRKHELALLLRLELLELLLGAHPHRALEPLAGPTGPTSRRSRRPMPPNETACSSTSVQVKSAYHGSPSSRAAA